MRGYRVYSRSSLRAHAWVQRQASGTQISDMRQDIKTLIEAAEEMIAFRESEQGLDWDQFLVKQGSQHDAVRMAISAVRDTESRLKPAKDRDLFETVNG